MEAETSFSIFTPRLPPLSPPADETEARPRSSLHRPPPTLIDELLSAALLRRRGPCRRAPRSPLHLSRAPRPHRTHFDLHRRRLTRRHRRGLLCDAIPRPGAVAHLEGASTSHRWLSVKIWYGMASIAASPSRSGLVWYGFFSCYCYLLLNLASWFLSLKLESIRLFEVIKFIIFLKISLMRSTSLWIA